MELRAGSDALAAEWVERGVLARYDVPAGAVDVIDKGFRVVADRLARVAGRPAEEAQ
jgi:hypothetical protein